MALKVGELFASFNLDTSGVSGAIDSAEKKMSSMGKNLMLGGAGMTAAITAPVTKAFSQIYSAGTDFDAEMSKVFAIAGDSVTGSAETMEALRNKALEMGSTTQFTATEAGEALEYMAMAGWKSDQMLSAIGPIMNLAAAAGADLGTTSDIVTDAMTAFGISVTDTWKTIKDGKEIDTGINNVEHFADILAAASSNANTNVTMLGESFKYAAPVAGTLGINAEDTAIALGLMANAGIKASQAGTSLRTGLTNMVKPSKQMREAMEKYGIGLVENKDGSVNLRETMIQLRKTMSGMTETEQAAAATAIFGKHSMAGWLAIVNASDEDFNKLTSAIDGATGSAAEMKRVMLDNAKGDVTIFKSALEGLEITLWGLAEGGFRKVVQEATKVVDSFRNADKSTQLGIVKMAGLAAAIGPVMTGLGGLITILPKLARTFSIVSGPAAMLAIGMVALGAAAIDSENNIGKTFVKGMAKAGVKIRKLGNDVKKQLPQLTSNMKNFLVSIQAGILAGLPNIITGLSDVLSSGISAISANTGEIAKVSQTLVTTLANSIKSNAGTLVPAVIDLLTNMASALISNIPVVLSGMATVITSLIKEVQNADWGEIATKLRESLEGAIKETGTLFKKLAMGDKYTEEASWADVGMALVTNLMDGIKTGFGNLRDFVGSLLLADDYDPDEDWATFGTKLIDKIFTGIDDATSGAESFVSGVIDGLASLFSAANISSATTALSTIVSRIITAAADEIPKLAGHATNILSKLSEMLLGDGKSQGTAAAATEGASKLAGAIITSIAQAIPHALDAAGNVLDAGLTLATKLLDSISSAFTTKNLDLNIGNIVQALINNIVKVLGGVLDFGNGLVTAGTRIASELLNSLAGAFDGVVSTNGVSVIGEKIKTLAQNIINGIVTILPRVFEVGGKAISAGMKLASELVKSLTEGFTSGEGLDIDFAGVANGIIEGIVSAISNLPQLLDDVLSAGAQIANAIMTSIVDSLADAETSGLGANLATAATQLIHGLLDSITNLGNNPDVQGFITKLGEGLKSAMYILGEFGAELVMNLFSADTLRKVFDAGKGLVNLILSGLGAALNGIGGFLDGIVSSILDGLGIIDKDAMRNEVDIGNALNDAIIESITDSEGNLEHSAESVFATIMGAYASGSSDAFENLIEGTPLEQITQKLDRFFFDNSNMWSGYTGTVEEFQQAFVDAFSGAGIDIQPILDTLPDDFWQMAMDSITGNANKGEGAPLMQLLLESLFGGTQETDNGEADSAITEFYENAGVTATEAANQTAETVKQGNANVIQAVQEGGNAFGQTGLETTLVNSEEPVAAAAAAVSDAAVQEFLLVMSEENGSAIATAFIGGMISVLSNTGEGSPVAEAQTLAEAARNAATTTLRWLDGYNIGHNFGLGLLRGIESMIQSVADAAARLGDAAAGALSGAIQEGSPSKLTAVTGRNFGLGFINSILDSVGDAENAAAMIGMSAASSLEQTISEISGDAADQMSITGNSRRNEAEALAAENEKTAMTYANAIANALNGARVVMNGELVGELVTDTVSEGIASRYAGMRYGTV